MEALLKIQRHPVQHPLLRRLIKFFWVLRSDEAVEINHNLLPVNNIDIVLNFASPLCCGGENFGRGYFSGIKENPTLIRQQGPMSQIGISFFPFGLYPFMKIPIAEFRNSTIELASLGNALQNRLEKVYDDTLSDAERVALLEQELLEELQVRDLPKGEVIHAVDTLGNPKNITCSLADFCADSGIHPRTLERQFLKYVGTSPKKFQRVTRFQHSINLLMKTGGRDLTGIAHDLHYSDQPHFINECKYFSGMSPSQFLSGANSLKQVMNVQ